ncbi:MAG: Type 1 glutamine amidotransferase-like domain-containing protein [Acidobacteria bacterium]|nr:Type 1 glutamine amidotransferase-like domain-containing protein [Acidobacteriota bacterium]
MASFQRSAIRTGHRSGGFGARLARGPRVLPLLLLFVAWIPGASAGRGYLCVEGGGAPGTAPWCASVFGWMVQRAGGGPALVVSTSDPGTKARDAFLLYGASSAATLVVTAANAEADAVHDAVAAARIVWFTGGDQAGYVQAWKGTRFARTVREVWEGGGVVGGSSAGAHILSDVVFDAFNGSAYGRDTLRDPYTPLVSFTTDFFAFTENVLFDTHFTERARIGRLPVFLARLAETGRDVLGVGLDDCTALCIDPDRIAEVRGEGAVTLIQSTGATRRLLEPGKPPVFTHLLLTQLTEGYRYDLAGRHLAGRPPAAVPAPGYAPAPVFLDGTVNGEVETDARKGAVWFDDTGDDLALFHGALREMPGTGQLGGAVLGTRVWESGAWDENRAGGVEYGLALHPGYVGFLLDYGVRVTSSGPARLTINPATEQESALLVLDSAGMGSIAFSTYVSSSASVGPRQSVALESATLHLLRSGWSYDAVARRPAAPPLPGDLDGDERVTALDAVLLHRFLAGTLAEIALCAANADADGNGRVDAADALKVLLLAVP